MIDLVTDRTQEDVDAVKALNDSGFGSWTADEVAAYLYEMKGAYNASDLNRVESAVKYLAQKFKPLGYDDLNFSIKTDWGITDFMNVSETKRYLQNIRRLKDQFTLPDGSPEVPADMDECTYAEANNIEKILLLLDEYIDKIEQTFFYSGELYGGEI